MTTQNNTQVAIWKQQLVKAESKFLAIEDNQKIAKRELGFAAQIIENNASLQGCDPNSILNAIINVARTGITLNPVMKLAYLVPRDKKCVLDFSYMGLVKLLKDHKVCKHMEAVIVYDDEEFEEGISQLTPPRHVKKYAKTEEDQKKRSIKGVYCTVLLMDNTVIYTTFMPYWDVQRTEKSAKGASSSYSPWNTFREEMIKKTKIKRDFKLLVAGEPSEQLAAALSLEEENNGLSDTYKGKKKEGIFDQFASDAEVVHEEPEKVAEEAPEAPNSDKDGQTKLA
jgi:recombination protein RecT